MKSKLYDDVTVRYKDLFTLLKIAEGVAEDKAYCNSLNTTVRFLPKSGEGHKLEAVIDRVRVNIMYNELKIGSK